MTSQWRPTTLEHLSSPKTTPRITWTSIYQALLLVESLKVNSDAGDVAAIDFNDDQMETDDGVEPMFLEEDDDSGSVAEDDNDDDEIDITIPSDLEIYISRDNASNITKAI